MNSPTPVNGASPAIAHPLTVSELTAQIRTLLETGFSSVWVTGEISQPSRPASGHIYFTLKDKSAELKAVVWRNAAHRIRFDLTHGLEVVAKGRITVYEGRGQYQLVVSELLPKGMGALELAFQQLKEKLSQRGWFAQERKKPLPPFPRRVALVTSPTGAAIRDMLGIMTRRWPTLEIWICPVAVQGTGAADQIAAALRLLNQIEGVDVIIVARGGGSLEDLWAFNQETLAEAIVASQIPVISAVGHQIDFTIADFVADRRAATPSEAAEMVVPDRKQVVDMLLSLQGRLRTRLTERWMHARQQLEILSRRRVFGFPLERLRGLEQQLDGRMERLQNAGRRCLELARQRLQNRVERLESLSPLNVLRRGYSLTQKKQQNQLLRSPADLRIGEEIVTRLYRGRVISRVEHLHPEE